MFWVAPIIGGVLAALFTRYVMDAEDMGPGAVEPNRCRPSGRTAAVVEPGTGDAGDAGRAGHAASAAGDLTAGRPGPQSNRRARRTPVG